MGEATLHSELFYFLNSTWLNIEMDILTDFHEETYYGQPKKAFDESG